METKVFSFVWWRNIKYLRLTAVFLFVLVGAIITYTHFSSAAGNTYTWDGGGGDGLWSTCTNWSSDICPGTLDTAAFASTTVTNSTVDASFAGSVKGVRISAGYTGTITQQRNLTIGSLNYVQASGVFNQATYDITLNAGSLSVSAGTFNAGVGTTTIDLDLTVTGSGVVNASSSRVFVFGSSQSASITYPGTFPGVVKFSKNYILASMTISSSTVIDKLADMSANTGSITINSGATLIATGTNVFAASLTVSGSLYASSTINLGDTLTINPGAILVNDATSSNIGGGFIVNGGTYSFSGKTINFNSSNDGTITYPGTFPGVVKFSKNYILASMTISSSTVIDKLADMSANTGSITINSGATLIATGTNVFAASLTVSGSLYASSTINATGNFTINAGAILVNDATSTYLGAGFIVNGGTYNFNGKTMIFNSSQNGTITYPGTFPGTMKFAKTISGFGLTISSSTVIDKLADMSSNVGDLTISSGATLTSSSTPIVAYTLTVNGALYSSTTITAKLDLILNSGGIFSDDGSTMNVYRNYTDNGGTSNLTPTKVTFNSNLYNSVMTLPGTFSGTIDVFKTNPSSSFTLASGSVAATNNITSSGPIIINGTLATGGYTLTGSTLTVGSTGTLRLYSNETITAPTLSAGSTVDYYGTSTYTTLNAGYSYSNLKFSSGTYNIGNSITVAGNFINSGAVFTETSGTTTFTGTTNTITGSNTFYNLSKNIGASSTIIFGAGATQTITGTTTLLGLNSSNRLYLISTSPGSQWYINPQGTRNFNFLDIKDGNNSNVLAVDCYSASDCTNSGNNTNFNFSAPPVLPPLYRFNGGVRLRGGVRL